jgi:transposase
LTTAGFECEHGVGCAHWRERERAINAEKAKNAQGKDVKGKGKGKGKGKAKSERAKEIEKMRADGVSYPSWDRYVVKLV